MERPLLKAVFFVVGISRVSHSRSCLSRSWQVNHTGDPVHGNWGSGSEILLWEEAGGVWETRHGGELTP